RSDTMWQPRPPDPELEAEMLRRLMVRLGVDETRAKTMLATDQAVERARLLKAGGTQTLSLQEPFDRAWRRVGLALDRVGFTVEDRDRSSGMYFVRYVDPEKDAQNKKDDAGFLSRMFSMFGSKKSTNVLTDEGRYRVFVKSEGEASTVSVLTREGGSDVSDTSRRILGLLYDQLK
ncbi:MAG: outer membrane protein assembly factor BamC, partial [Rhodocyclaceae bacterium]|nr:outer membrane protein assembly factor BamC [Rhodocyclaceae bacterium]